MEIGEKLKRLRMQRGLTQEELADRCELTKGFISQIERDLTSPSISTLMDLLQSLGTDLRAFFSERGEQEIVFTEADTFLKEDPETLKGSVRWLVPDAQKNEMEPILVRIGPQGATSPDDPHEGEEFGYVLAGSVTLALGEKRHRARKGASFYFTADAAHYLINPGKTDALVLWVVTPPSF